MDFQDVLQLVELIKASSNFSEIKLRFGDVEVELRRAGAAALATPAAAAASLAPAIARAAAAAEAALPREAAEQPAAGTGETSSPAQSARQASNDAGRKSSREGMTLIKSPMVGTVYLAPEPGAPPFVALGQAVSPGDQVCIVEVMKLMNSIDAGCRGVIAEILVGDGEAVEYGQELFVISPR
ncbi:MAG: acetyl-CoA carboxylase biotin carboxyl carrier protein [Variovorax sp.]|nr:MAG: acetyl-CoA carboxylase biotin carboxyl carrier protein [Variovorax sp.]